MQIESRQDYSNFLLYPPCAQVPADILQDAALNAAIAVLPSNYSFEVCTPQEELEVPVSPSHKTRAGPQNCVAATKRTRTSRSPAVP